MMVNDEGFTMGIHLTIPEEAPDEVDNDTTDEANLSHHKKYLTLYTRETLCHVCIFQ